MEERDLKKTNLVIFFFSLASIFLCVFSSFVAESSASYGPSSFFTRQRPWPKSVLYNLGADPDFGGWEKLSLTDQHSFIVHDCVLVIKNRLSLSIDTVIISVQTVSPLERVRIPLSHAPIRWAAWLFGFVFLCMCVLFVPLFFSSDVVSWVHLLHTAKGVRKNFLKIGALKRYNLSSDKTPSSSSSSIYI